MGYGWGSFLILRPGEKGEWSSPCPDSPRWPLGALGLALAGLEGLGRQTLSKGPQKAKIGTTLAQRYPLRLRWHNVTIASNLRVVRKFLGCAFD